MIISTHSKVVTSTRMHIVRSRNLIATSSNLSANSQKRINNGNKLVARSTKGISDSRQRIYLTITVLIGHFLASALTKLSTQVEPHTLYQQIPQRTKLNWILHLSKSSQKILTISPI
jgi:hypothetical protein